MNDESGRSNLHDLRDQLQQLAEYDTALLANLLNYVDATPTHLMYMSNEIHSLIPDVGPTVGIAVTCELDSSSPDGETDGDASAFWEQLTEMEAMTVPTVWVVSCVGSRPRHECIMGDGMGKALVAAGCVGAITNGGIRDLAGLRSIGFGAYGTGVTIHHCKLRFQTIGKPVDIGGITVNAGDIVHANSEGVIRIPPAAVSALAEQAPSYRAFEHEAHQLLRRTNISAVNKRELLKTIIERYGFEDCTAVDADGEKT